MQIYLPTSRKAGEQVFISISVSLHLAGQESHIATRLMTSAGAVRWRIKSLLFSLDIARFWVIGFPEIVEMTNKENVKEKKHVSIARESTRKQNAGCKREAPKMLKLVTSAS